MTIWNGIGNNVTIRPGYRSTTVTRRSLDCLPVPLHHFCGCWTRKHALWPTCILVIMWHQSSVLSTGFLSVSAYNTNCVFWCMVLLMGMHPTTSAIWPHWHQLHRVGHIFALPTASPLISLGRGQGWAIGHCQSLVHVPGMHFRLTFAVHLVWTLLRSISKHICFLLPTIYNNCFTQFYSLFYTPGTYIIVCSADHSLV